MEKMMKLMSILALGAAMTVASVSCQREDPMEDPSEKGCVFVTVGAGIADAATKSEVASEDGKRVLKFTAGDKLYVCNPSFDDEDLYHLAGILEIENESLSADGKSARFSGEVMAYDSSSGNEAPWVDLSGIDALEGTTAYLIHAGTTQGIDYSISDSYYNYYALDYGLQDAADVETLMTQCLPVTGAYNSGTESYSLSCPYPIFNCTLSGLEASHEYNYSFGKDIGGGWLNMTSYGSFTTDANGSAHIAFLSYEYDEGAWELRIKNANDLVGAVDLGTRTFTSKVYNISRFWNGTAFRTYTNLSSIASDYTASDGEVLTGTLLSDCELRITADATVVLAGVTHHAGYRKHGILCPGNANIILAAGTTNDLTRGDDKAFCGIGTEMYGTITISGTGTLMASGGDDYPGIGGVGTDIVINGGDITATGGNKAAGIGSVSWDGINNITITGGTVTATGGFSAAGIGSGGEDGYCGVITISGGTVTATGVFNAAGIGSGYDGECGNIIISGPGTSVTATKGEIAPCSIGQGAGGTCGSVTIGGIEYKSGISTSPYTWPTP